MKEYNISFRMLLVGSEFSLNETKFIKKSSKTAKLVENDRIFHFGKYERIVITDPHTIVGRRRLGIK